jgi:hypothetical protein
LVFLIDHLGEDLGEACCGVEHLTHHDNELAYHHNAVKLIGDFGQVLLEKGLGLLIDGENSETIVVAVAEDGLGCLQTNELGHICDLLGFHVDPLNNLVDALRIKVTNVKALLAVYLITELGESLSQTKCLYLSVILLLYLVGHLVGALGT